MRPRPPRRLPRGERATPGTPAQYTAETHGARSAARIRRRLRASVTGAKILGEFRAACAESGPRVALSLRGPVSKGLIMHARVFVAALLTAAYAGAGCGSSPTNPTPPPAACTYQLSSSTQTLGSAAGTATITVTTTASCTWSASVDQSWLSTASGGSGTG